jgi:hypothetical protein
LTKAAERYHKLGPTAAPERHFTTPERYHKLGPTAARATKEQDVKYTVRANPEGKENKLTKATKEQDVKYTDLRHGDPRALPTGFGCARGLRAPRLPRQCWRRVPPGGDVDLGVLLLERGLQDPSMGGGLLATIGVGEAPLRPGEKVIDVVVDSGAVASVAPKGLFPGALESSIMSRAGRTYRAANGSPIRNFGQVRVPFVSAEGHKCSFPFQVAEVEHALLSVGHLAEAGNRVELGAKGGRIVNIATGRAMALTRRGGVYVLRLRVSGFPRPGATKQ